MEKKKKTFANASEEETDLAEIELATVKGGPRGNNIGLREGEAELTRPCIFPQHVKRQRQLI